VIVRWSDRARSQVAEIFDYIARDRPDAAERLLEGFLERTELLAVFPEQGPVWGGENRPDLRSVVHENHRIVYRVRPDEVAILSVRHTRQEPEANPEEV
jgi:plasmid stabilization system protein ParE